MTDDQACNLIRSNEYCIFMIILVESCNARSHNKVAHHTYDRADITGVKRLANPNQQDA